MRLAIFVFSCFVAAATHSEQRPTTCREIFSVLHSRRIISRQLSDKQHKQLFELSQSIIQGKSLVKIRKQMESIFVPVKGDVKILNFVEEELRIQSALNAFVKMGLLASVEQKKLFQSSFGRSRKVLSKLMHTLFNTTSIISTGAPAYLPKARVLFLESEIDELVVQLQRNGPEKFLAFYKKKYPLRSKINDHYPIIRGVYNSLAILYGVYSYFKLVSPEEMQLPESPEEAGDNLVESFHAAAEEIEKKSNEELLWEGIMENIDLTGKTPQEIEDIKSKLSEVLSNN